FTDLHVLYALRSGLIDECAAAFPDPRWDPQIPIRVLLTAAVAGALAGGYALCETGAALHSPAVLSELGYNVAWRAPGAGVARRGNGRLDPGLHEDRREPGEPPLRGERGHPGRRRERLPRLQAGAALLPDR